MTDEESMLREEVEKALSVCVGQAYPSWQLQTQVEMLLQPFRDRFPWYTFTCDFRGSVVDIQIDYADPVDDLPAEVYAL